MDDDQIVAIALDAIARAQAAVQSAAAPGTPNRRSGTRNIAQRESPEPSVISALLARLGRHPTTRTCAEYRPVAGDLGRIWDGACTAIMGREIKAEVALSHGLMRILEFSYTCSDRFRTPVPGDFVHPLRRLGSIRV